MLKRKLLIALSLACLEIHFGVNDAGAVKLLFRLQYKTSVIRHNVNTQKLISARGDKKALHRCETFQNLLRPY